MLDRNGNVIPGALLDALEIGNGLAVLERQVRETWLAEDYPTAVRDDFAQFRHACLHSMKALGKISAYIDHAEHERLDDPEAQALKTELPKLLADLVRCAAKMAQTADISLAKSYVVRAQQLAARWGH